MQHKSWLSNAAALEKNSTPGEAVEKNLGHRKSVEDLRSIINTSLTARRWQSKTVSKALPALAPFVPRMLRDDLLTAQPRCLAGSAGHAKHPEQPDEENDSKSVVAPCGTAFVATGSQSTTHNHAERLSTAKFAAHLFQALAMCMHKTGLLTSKPLALSAMI